MSPHNRQSDIDEFVFSELFTKFILVTNFRVHQMEFFFIFSDDVFLMCSCNSILSTRFAYNPHAHVSVLHRNKNAWITVTHLLLLTIQFFQLLIVCTEIDRMCRHSFTRGLGRRTLPTSAHAFVGEYIGRSATIEYLNSTQSTHLIRTEIITKVTQGQIFVHFSTHFRFKKINNLLLISVGHNHNYD